MIELPNYSLLQLEQEAFKRHDFDFITISGAGKHLKQEEALMILTDDQTVEFAYGGAAGGAKSWTGCTWLLFMCLLYPGTKWFIGREELKRITESTLLTFFKVCKEYGVQVGKDFRYNGQSHNIIFANGSKIDLLDLKFLPSDKYYERYGSLEYTGGWIEEGGEINVGAFDTLKSRIGRHMNDHYGLIRKLFVTCNPKKNWIYTYFYKPWHEKRLPEDIRFLQALVQDNPFRESGYIDALLSIKDKAKKQRLYFGNWEYDDDPATLIPYDVISNMFTNDFVNPGKAYLTIDVARFGQDKTRIIRWNGFRAEQIITMEKCKITDINTKIVEMQRMFRIPKTQTVADDDGVGGGLVDLNKCYGFVNGSKPIFAKRQEQYVNLRSQCYFLFCERANENEYYISTTDIEEREMITEELGAIKIKDIDGDEKKKAIISREDMKEILGRSPDYASALMMREYFELLAFLGPSHQRVN